MIYTKEIIIKSLLEFGRIILLAIIPVAISSIEQGQLDLKAMAVAGVIAGLKAIDKLLHSLGQQIEEETGEPSGWTQGLTRF